MIDDHDLTPERPRETNAAGDDETRGDGIRSATEPEPADATSSQGTADEAQRALDELRDKFLRLAAEYDNYRKRTSKERLESGTRAQAELVKTLLDPLDDLGRVMAQDPTSIDAATIHAGVEAVDKKMWKALGAAGLEVIDPVDQAFNPELHEAIATEPALSPEDDHVVSQVYQLGYLFKGQLLRPARVVVKQWNR